MKILHVITSLRTGGAEKLMVDLLPRLQNKGQEVDLLLFDGTDTPFRKEAEKAGIKVFDLGVGGSVYSPIKLLRLIPYLKRYDIVHTHNTAPQLFAAIGSMLCSVVLCTTEHTTSNRRRGWKWYAAVDRWMYSRYRHVVCISPETETNLRTFIGSVDTTISTIANGIDIARIEHTPETPIDKAASGCGIAIMQVAGFRYQKDQETVIKALCHLPENFHLYLVGDGERRHILEKLVEDLNIGARVHFLGQRSDVPGLLKASDIVVMSSHWEGFGLAAVEGMAAERPVIASDVNGLKQVVEGAGLLFPHQDEKTLANRILKLAQNPEYYKSVADACFERARQYDISKMADGYAQVYQSL